MDSLFIKKKSYQKLQKYCTSSLLDHVLDDLGNYNIDTTNSCEDNWCISSFLDVEHLQLLDRLKVIYVFSVIGGNIVYQDEVIPYQVLFRKINCDEPNIVLRYWLHNLYNDLIPTFDIGELYIPKVMPRFVCLKETDNLYRIEKWYKGEYILLNETYPIKELCEARVKELNDDYQFEPILL